MASELFSSLSPDEVALRLRNERVEPDFGPPSVPRPMIQRGNQIPEASSPSRCSDDTSLPVGMLLYLASVAVVAAAIIGSFFGSGFFLLRSTANKVITDFDHNPPRVYGGTPEADREAVLVSRQTGMPHSVAVDVLPSGSPLGQNPTADEAGGAAAAKQGSAGVLAGTSNGEPPPSETARASEPASSSATPPVSPMALANPPSFAAKDPVAPADPKARPARDGHSAHTRPAPQHSRPRSVHNAPTLTSPQLPFAQTLIPPQPSSFGQTKPVRQALTPPKAEQPDPKRDKMPAY
jgi:hypothetical protein